MKNKKLLAVVVAFTMGATMLGAVGCEDKKPEGGHQQNNGLPFSSFSKYPLPSIKSPAGYYHVWNQSTETYGAVLCANITKDIANILYFIINRFVKRGFNRVV